MRALVTGCDGYLGSHLAEHLLSQGYEVHGLIQHTEPHPNLAAIRTRLLLTECEIRNPDSVAAAIERACPDEIYHLAAIASVPQSLAEPRLTYETNVLGTANVLEAARRSRPSPRLLYVSTAQLYATSDASTPLAEDAPLDPRSPYAVSKFFGESLVRYSQTAFGLHVLIARPFNSIGPRQAASLACSDFARQIARIALGQQEPTVRAGDLSRARDFTDARDLVRALRLIVREGRSGETYNVASGNAHRLEDAVGCLARLAGVEVRLEREDARRREYDPIRIVGDASRLRQETGWRPDIPFTQSLADLLAYWKEVEEQRIAVGA